VYEAPSFIRFLNVIDARVAPKKIVQAIVDNYAAHEHSKVLEWLARRPRAVSAYLDRVLSRRSRDDPQTLRADTGSGGRALGTEGTMHCKEGPLAHRARRDTLRCERNRRNIFSDNRGFRIGYSDVFLRDGPIVASGYARVILSMAAPPRALSFTSSRPGHPASMQSKACPPP
jgi:hypothetical protein